MYIWAYRSSKNLVAFSTEINLIALVVSRIFAGMITVIPDKEPEKGHVNFGKIITQIEAVI